MYLEGLSDIPLYKILNFSISYI